MEELPVTPLNNVNIPKTEKSVEPFSFSEHEKNIQEVFKLNPELKQIACDSLGIENDQDIIIEVGRNKENVLGKIQDINVYYKGEKIIDCDNQDGSKLYLVTKEDGTSYVGDIFMPTELQGQGLGKKILQKVSDTLNTKIVPTYLSTGGFTSDDAKKMWGKIGNEILPNHETEKLYAKYLKTIFPKSKIQDIVYHSSSNKIEKFRDNFFGTYFSYSPIQGTYGNIINCALLNVENPLIKPQTRDSNEVKEMYNKDYRNYNNPISFSPEGIGRYKNDASMESSTVTKEGIQIRVRNPEQIHILGSKSDIEKFKEFVSKTQRTKMD
jgi:hypothetical protein